MSKMCVLYYTLMFHRLLCFCVMQMYSIILNIQNLLLINIRARESDVQRNVSEPIIAQYIV